MRLLETHQERWLYQQSASAWARYIDCKHNDDQADQLKLMTPPSQNQLIRQAYSIKDKG